ncbi:hypothetical protein [Frankia sp. Cr1]|uniref:hypothetical protein n=1 Tax=Frankia sp. Cr1 TaxID=3073931 RepID=UPI002AD56111|nr:hypothetical protein [Frankia sp. Cr1]
MSAPARAGAFARFLREADPEGLLPYEERVERAKRLQALHMKRIAIKSAEARRRRAAPKRQRRARGPVGGEITVDPTVGESTATRMAPQTTQSEE